MKTFHCDACNALVFFENVRCLNCHETLAYIPELADVSTVIPGDNGLWTSADERLKGRRFRLCKNSVDHEICNWAVPSEDPEEYCQSCRLTRTIPDLNQPGNLMALKKLETAKRRLVYTLMSLRLSVANKTLDPDHGLVYDFKVDLSASGGEKVLTGHDDGVITMNIAEADDAERERRRLALNEPYRTLLGHLRHEVGHYYWDLLIEHSNLLDGFRKLFGDERENYQAALEHHYEGGAPADWPTHYVSAYATMHPWEDWAETWAHYLHIVDTLETAAACGFSLKPLRPDEPALEVATDPVEQRAESFDVFIEQWLALTYALNSLNRSLGQPDAYPFVLPEPAIEKLRFVHTVITGVGSSEQVPAVDPQAGAAPAEGTANAPGPSQTQTQFPPAAMTG
jgi:hypothetical protein